MLIRRFRCVVTIWFR